MVCKKLYIYAAAAACAVSCQDNNKDANSGDNSNVIVQKCDPAQDICLSEGEVLHCVGDIRKREYCAADEKCFEGKCGKIQCEPYEILSCNEDGTYRGCNPAGTGIGDYDCPDNKTCAGGECRMRLCEKGSGNCRDSETILLCNAAGTGYDDERKCNDLKEKTVCENGACISICDQSTKNASYIGCE